MKDRSYNKNPVNDIYRESRLKANSALHKFGILKTEFDNYSELIRLLGYPSFLSSNDFILHMTEEDYKITEALAGPNGYTIYRMLLIKHGLTESKKTVENS